MPDCDWPIILERISTNQHLLRLDKGSLLLSFLKPLMGLDFSLAQDATTGKTQKATKYKTYCGMKLPRQANNSTMTESPKSAKYICTLLGRQNHFQVTSWNQSTAAIHFQCNFCSHSEKLAKWLQTAWQPLHKPCTTDQRSCFPRLFNFVSVPNIQMYTGSNFGGIFCVFLVLHFMAVLLELCLYASNDFLWSFFPLRVKNN